MAFLPGVGTVSYNGYSFNGSLKSRISARFVYDQAERTVIYVIYTIDITSIIVNSGSSTDTPMDDLRNRLSKPGQCLQFTTTGLGTMNVNCSLNSALDVFWGPKVRTLDMESIGSSQAWRVRWVCEVAIPQCTTAKYQGFPVAFNYELTYSIGEDGLTTRTYDGYVEVPISAWPGNGRRVGDAADRLRSQINPPGIPGFRRRPGEFKLSADRRTLRFTITDIEMTPDGIPAYCTNAGGSHSIRTLVANTFRFEGTISAHYTVSPREPKTRAWEMFYLLLVDRLTVAQAAAGPTGLFIITHIELTEGLYSDALNMSFMAQYTFSSSVDTFLIASGMWRPMVGTDWNDWAASVQNILNERGAAGLFYDKRDDAVLDLCASLNPPTPTPNNSTSMRTVPFPESSMRGEVNPNNSWLSMRAQIKTEGDSGTHNMRSLPRGQMPDPVASTPGPLGGASMNAQPDPPDFNNSGTVSGAVQGSAPKPTPNGAGGGLIGGIIGFAGATAVGAAGGSIADFAELSTNPLLRPPLPEKPAAPKPSGGTSPPPSLPPSTPLPPPGKGNGVTVQQRLQPTYKVTLEGSAIRLGYQMSPPVLRQLNGAYCVPAGKAQFVQEQIGVWFGVPIYGAAWRIPYLLVGAPSGDPGVPENFECVHLVDN